MKKNQIIVLVVLVVLAIILLLVSKKKEDSPVVVVPANTTVETETADTSSVTGKEFCYYKETKGASTTDVAFTSIKYGSGNTVSGVINWIPGEKDSLVGSYKGTMSKNENMAGYPTKLNIVYTASGEGITNKQEEILIVGANDIKTAIGEKFLDKDGIFKFKTLNNLTYNNSLPLSDCSTVPDRFKKNYTN